jgi:hypothetical protein
MTVAASREMWKADGVELATYAYNISSFAYATPSLNGQTTRLPQRSGSIPRYNRSYAPGEFGINMWILGCNTDGTIPTTWADQRAAFEANRDALMSLLCKQSATILFTKTLYDGTVIRSRALPTPESVQFATQMAMRRGEITLMYELVDSFWEEQTQRTASTATGATLPKTLTMSTYAPSTAPLEDAVLTVAGPITNPRVTDTESGSWVQYSGTVSAGASWVLNAGTFSSMIGATDKRADTSHGGHARFIYIPPRKGLTAAPELTLSGSGGGTATQLTVTFRRKFLLP